MLTRILFIWTFKHPASGYVQGINDLAATLLYVFLMEDSSEAEGITEAFMDTLSEDRGLEIESDTYWCLEKFSENIQANYTEGQPGVYKTIELVQNLVKKEDPELVEVLDMADYNIDKFVYRWINCILTREFTLA